MSFSHKFQVWLTGRDMVYYIVGSLLLVATITDIFWRRIPNVLVLIYFVSGIFILHSDFLIRFCISLVIFSALYRLKFFGAGDVKLFSLIIGFLGVYEGINMSVIALIFAGAGALVYLIFSAQLVKRFNMLVNYCIRVLACGHLEKYGEYGLRDKHMMPMAPYFLAGFILWRCFC